MKRPPETPEDRRKRMSELGKLSAQKRKEAAGEEGFSKRMSEIGKLTQGGGFGSEKTGDDGLTGKQRAKIASTKGLKARWGKRGEDNEDSEIPA